MKQHLTATFIFDPINTKEFTKVSARIAQLVSLGYHEKVRNMNKEGKVVIKLEFEEEM